MFSNIPTLALLAASASAAAVPSYPTASWVWSVSDYTSTCTASECRYGLNVSAPVGPSGEPCFDASGCIGNSIQGDYKSCAVVGIDVPGDVFTEQFNHGIDVGASLSVRVTFTRDGATYTYTGNSSVAHTSEPVAFEVVPTEVSAIA